MSEETKNNPENPEEERHTMGVPDPSPNYEGEPTPPMPPEDEPITTQTTLPPITRNEERTWAMLAHLSVLLNLITGFLGGIAAIVIYFAYKDRSRYVAYHAMQAFIFQAITWLGGGLLAGLFIGFGTALAILIIPLLCLVPGFLALLLLPASLIYGIIGAVQVNNDQDFHYWQVGDWVRDILEPKPVP